MTTGFFAALNPQERHDIHARTATLAELLNQWVQRYPRARVKRIPPVALLLAAVAPRLSVPAALLTAQMTFWIFMLDDLADERTITLTELRRKAKVWCRLARTGSTRRNDQLDELDTLLLEIRADLAAYPLFKPLLNRWATQVRLIAEAMAQEYHYGLQYHARPARPLPALDEYLHYGSYSIGIPLWATVALIVADDDSVLKCLKPLDATLLRAGAAIRLYNDYQTLDKELQEGNINAVLILNQRGTGESAPAAPDHCLAAARRHTLDLADYYARRCQRLAEQHTTDSGQINETITRIVAFHADFYRERDYHTTSPANVAEVLTVQHKSGWEFAPNHL